MNRYEEARQLVLCTENFSIAFMQRKLGLGYVEAARLLEALNDNGEIDWGNKTILDDVNEQQTEEWIGIGLDGTLAFYDEWRGVDHIGEPIQPMIDFLKTLLSEGKKVKIFTARVENVESRVYIREWLQNSGIEELEITNKKDFGMIMLYDDRCTQVITNSGEIVKNKTGE